MYIDGANVQLRECVLAGILDLKSVIIPCEGDSMLKILVALRAPNKLVFEKLTFQIRTKPEKRMEYDLES